MNTQVVLWANSRVDCGYLLELYQRQENIKWRIQMKIAICDDEISVLNETKSLLAEYCKDYDREISCDVF